MAVHTDRWYFSREQLQNTPSRKCGVEPEKELSYRQQSANLIQDMGQRLQVNQLCINTAIVYMHRFYMFQSFTRFPRNSIAAACLFLAAKVEEQPHKLEHVLKVAHLCLHRGAPSLDTKSDVYMQQSQELVINESIILQTFAFDVGVSHPHTHVVKCTQMIRAHKDLAQTSYFMATNSLHLTTFCLQYKPTLVACVCVHLACKWSQYEIPKSNDGNYWWEYVDSTVTRDLLDRFTMEFLQIIEACPSRLKRRIEIHKEQVTAAKNKKKDDGTITKPGSQSSVDSGFADLNDDSARPFQLASDLLSPWLPKPKKPDDRPEPGKSSADSAEKPGSLPAAPLPVKRSFAEYQLQKEKERLVKEKRVNEEKMKMEKQKLEKRRAYEAQLMKADGKLRPPKHEAQRPNVGSSRPHSSGGQRAHEGAVRPHASGERPTASGERPSASGERSSHVPSGKIKAEPSGDPHVKLSREHHKTRPGPPTQGGESHRPDPSPAKRPPHHPGKPGHNAPTMQSLPKDARHQERVKGHPPPVKTERLDDRKRPPDSNRSKPGERPRPGVKPHVPVHQPRTPPLHCDALKTESPLLIPKPHQLLQAEKDDDDQVVNDDLSDLRDEIMRDLEKDTTGSDLSMLGAMSAPPAPPPMVKRRTSLDNLRQVAQEELTHMKRKSETESPSPNRGGREQNVKLKSEHTSPVTISKKLRSPAKMGREMTKGLNRSSSLAQSKSISPLQKKRVLTDTMDKSPSGSQQSENSVLGNKLNNAKPKEPKTDVKESSSKHKTLPPSSAEMKITASDPERALIKVEQKETSTVERGPKHSVQEKASPVLSSARKSVAGSQAVNSSTVKREPSKKPPPPDGTPVAKVRTKVKVERPVTSMEQPSTAKPGSVSTPSTTTPAELSSAGAVKNIESLKVERKSSPGVVPTPEASAPVVLHQNSSSPSVEGLKTAEGQRESPKHKHRHKDKKKHKKHRQEKQLAGERSASPSVESTSILTTSGGIKLKIKGLSLGGSPGNSAGGGSRTPQDDTSIDGGAGNLKIKLNASPNTSGKEHKHHRHKTHKSRGDRKDAAAHPKKRQQNSSPNGTDGDEVPAKKRAVLDVDGRASQQSSVSLLSLPMPPPDPKRPSPPTAAAAAKHSSRHKSKKHHQGRPPPPPPPRRPVEGDAESPPPPPPPKPKPPSMPQLETVTALPPMETDPNAYGSQYLYHGAQGSNGSVAGHRGKKKSHHQS